MDRKNKIKNKWSIFKENNPSAHVFLTIVIINVVFVLVSSALLIFLPENQGRGFFEMIRFAFTLMVNPSGRYIYSDYPISLIITTVVVLLGMISLTGGTVGYVTSIINGILERAANSKSKIDLENHIVILNYNNRVPALIQDYCFDDVDSTYIVVLSNLEKDYVQEKINLSYAEKRKKRFKHIIVRDGDPMSKIDLDNISLYKAKTVLIMMPDADSDSNETAERISKANIETTKLFMFVSLYLSDYGVGNKKNIVVESGSQDMEYMIGEYKIDEDKQVTVPVNFDDIIGKVLAITSIMPSLHDVLRILFSFEGVEMYIKDKPDISILDELKESRSALPLYDYGDKRIYVAEDEDEIGRIGKADLSVLSKLVSKTETNVAFAKNSILIIGVSEKLTHIMESLASFAEEYGNNIFVLIADTAEKREVLENYYSDPRFSKILDTENHGPVIIEDIYHPQEQLTEDMLKDIQTILFLSDETAESEHIDEKPLLFWSGLRNVNRKIESQDMIVEVLSAQNHRMIEKKNKDQIVVSDSFLGHFYAQLGKDPGRLDIMKDFLSTGDEPEEEENNANQNDVDLLVLNTKSFCAPDVMTKEFSSKREFILWLYQATDGEYLPIGCIKDNVTYMFSRTESKDDALDSSAWLGMEETQVLFGGDRKFKVEDMDELILVKNNK